jgi:hypothetical protein
MTPKEDEEIDAETIKFARGIKDMNFILKRCQEMGVPEDEVQKIGYVLRKYNPAFEMWRRKGKGGYS